MTEAEHLAFERASREKHQYVRERLDPGAERDGVEERLQAPSESTRARGRLMREVLDSMCPRRSILRRCAARSPRSSAWRAQERG